MRGILAAALFGGLVGALLGYRAEEGASDRAALVKVEKKKILILRTRVETLERAFWGLIRSDDSNDDMAGFFARLKNVEKFLESRMDFQSLNTEEEK